MKNHQNARLGRLLLRLLLLATIMLFIFVMIAVSMITGKEREMFFIVLGVLLYVICSSCRTRFGNGRGKCKRIKKRLLRKAAELDGCIQERLSRLKPDEALEKESEEIRLKAMLCEIEDTRKLAQTACHYYGDKPAQLKADLERLLEHLESLANEID